MLLFSRRSEDHSGPSAFSKKIKPLVRHASGRDRDRTSIDLNMSKAENAERGAYVSDTTQPSATSARSLLGGHARTTSGNSQLSSSNNSIHNHRANSYVHPARQIPHSPTPPIPSTGPFSPPDLDRPSSSHSNLASIPSLPPPGHFRSAVGGGVLRSSTSTPTQMAGPFLPPTASSTAAILSTSVPATSRSSIDSSFRERITAGLGGSRHRSRTNSNAPLDPEEEARTVAALRADFNAREAAKDEKYRRREEKRDRRRSEAEERKARRRRGNSGATAGSNGSGIAASTWSAASEITNITVPGTANSSPRKNRSGSGRKSRVDDDEDEGRRSLDHLEGLRYANTAQSRRPTLDVAKEGDEDDLGTSQPVPKRGKKQGIASAGKATQSLWMTFWFKVQTARMKAVAKKK